MSSYKIEIHLPLKEKDMDPDYIKKEKLTDSMSLFEMGYSKAKDQITIMFFIGEDCWIDMLYDYCYIKVLDEHGNEVKCLNNKEKKEWIEDNLKTRLLGDQK